MEGDIVLNDNVQNYSYIKIFCITNDKHEFVQEIHNANNKKITLHTAILGNTSFFIKSKVYLISDNTMNIVKGQDDVDLCGEFNLLTNQFNRDRKFVCVYKVIGYII
jgi:hypothetical protein